jgi:DNA-binding SARP family transcriptional activator/TolB-like protein
MHSFRLLGGIELSGADGKEVDGLLRQPKRVALLAYLALPRPGTWHRRDSLLATFWPETEQLKARTALRSALYTLRRHLDEGAIRTRGDDEVSLDPQIFSTDVAKMMDDIAANRHAEALELYTGDLLPGLHIDEAEGFEKWLGSERSRLSALAGKSALLLAGEREKAGNLSGAIEAARRASEIDPDDEAAARRWIALLDRAGDRAQAFAVYEKFRKHMAEEFGTRPSAETVALVDAVRTRRESNLPAVVDPPAEPSIAAQPVTMRETPPAVSLTVNGPPPPPARVAAVRSSSKWLWAIAAVALLAIVVAWTAMRGKKETGAPNVSRSLVVLPAENETGDPKLDYVGAGIAEGVATRLEGIGGLKIRSGARSDWPARTLHDYKAIGREFGSTVLLRTSLSRVGDSLEIRAAVVDATTSGERALTARRFSTAQLRDVESLLAADVAGTLFRVPLPALPRAMNHPINPESYRLMLEGWHQLLGVGNRPVAQQLFQKAADIDPTNARAWSGLSSVWALQSLQTIPFDVGYDRASAAAARALSIDSLQGSALANLAIMRAFKYRSLNVGVELINKAAAAEPANPEIFIVKSTLYRHAHQWDQAVDAARVARAMDPLNPVYAEREAFAELCADRPQVALKLYQAEVNEFPTFEAAQTGLHRSLARLGRYDEAIAAWRKFVSPKDSELVRVLATARGREGYFSARHVEGRAAVAALEKQGAAGFVSKQRLMQARILAGDLDRGFKDLEAAATDRDQRVYHLPCMPGVDEVRDTPRFKAIVARVGGLPP